jgi:ABC-type Fe2+-enterobactin transport system substrate-binding protein
MEKQWLVMTAVRHWGTSFAITEPEIVTATTKPDKHRPDRAGHLKQESSRKHIYDRQSVKKTALCSA